VLLSQAPTFVPPSKEELLLLYIAATTQLVSAALVVEWEEEGHALKLQRPVYFVGKILTDAKTRYPWIQKLVYTVLIAKWKLRHYFKSHPITMITSFLLGEVVRTPDTTGRVAE
jgi:hypothetical protein